MVAEHLVGFQRPKRRSVRLTPEHGRRAWRVIRRLPSLLWRGPVRARLTIAATIVVGVALAAGAVAVLAVLRATLTQDVRTAASLRATQIAASISDADGVVPVIGNQDGELVQVIDGSGRAVGGSPHMTGAAPMPGPGIGDYVIADGLVDDGHYLLVQALADRPGMAGAPFTVLVARDLDDATDPVTAVTVALAVVVPTLLLIVGGTTWRVTGSALAPVEAIRREVDAISGSELHRRVPDQPGTDEIARLAGTMNRMLDRLEHAQVQQRRFVSDASHELRSPVAAIRQYAEVATAHPTAISSSDLAAAVLAEDLRVQRLIEDLLMLARADEAGLALGHRPIDLDDLALAEAGYLRRSTKLVVDTAGVAAGRVNGDRMALARVLRNLGENAARHARGRIEFTVEQVGARVRMSVEDDGPGIPDVDRVRVFERFVRLDAARAGDAGGSGLGLAIVAELVRAHGGQVTAGAGTLGGALIRIHLPAAAE
jgi:signal transduction histidine kinase